MVVVRDLVAMEWEVVFSTRGAYIRTRYSPMEARSRNETVLLEGQLTSESAVHEMKYHRWKCPGFLELQAQPSCQLSNTERKHLPDLPLEFRGPESEERTERSRKRRGCTS